MTEQYVIETDFHIGTVRTKSTLPFVLTDEDIAASYNGGTMYVTKANRKYRLANKNEIKDAPETGRIAI